MPWSAILEDCNALPGLISSHVLSSCTAISCYAAAAVARHGVVAHARGQEEGRREGRRGPDKPSSWSYIGQGGGGLPRAQLHKLRESIPRARISKKLDPPMFQRVSHGPSGIVGQMCCVSEGRGARGHRWWLAGVLVCLDLWEHFIK